MPDEIDQILSQVSESINSIDSEQFRKSVDRIAEAHRIIVTGAGRSGLLAGMFAQRLYHIGFQAWSDRDLSRPPLDDKDLLIACSGSGETAHTIALTETAVREDVPVLALIGHEDSTLFHLATTTFLLPSPAFSPSETPEKEVHPPAQSGFERSLFVVCEGLVRALIKKEGVSGEQMKRRHTNIE